MISSQLVSYTNTLHVMTLCLIYLRFFLSGKVSVLSSIAESMKSGSSSKSVPSSIAQIRLTPPDTPNARDLIAKDEKIARLERELEVPPQS